MKHALILSAVHCEPEVIKYTLGTWLETYDGSYKATVCLSVQSDYAGYSTRLAEITDMPNVEVITVKPIDFTGASTPYSRCHARNLRHLVEHCQDWPFTHVAILDHDLEFKSDFIRWAIDQDKDWVLNMFRDRLGLIRLSGQNWAPKPSIWHMVLSRSLFEKVVDDPQVLLPDCMFGSLVYDTAAKLYDVATAEWGVDMAVYPESEIETRVKHLWSLSFCYGLRDCAQRSGQPILEYERKLAAMKKMYAKRFPDGIDHLLLNLTPPLGI